MTSTASRSGPRNDLDVHEALLDAAERLFGTASIDAVSLRAIARDAGVGSAAVSYYFDSKESLTRAVVERRAVGLNYEVRRRCLDLLEQDEPQMLDLVAVMLEPLADLLNSDPVGGLAWLKIYTWLGQVEDPIFVDSIAAEPRVDGLFLQALGKVLGTDGELPVAVQRRAGIAMFSIMHALSRADTTGFGSGALGRRRLDPEYVEQLGLFAAAGLSGVVARRSS